MDPPANRHLWLSSLLILLAVTAFVAGLPNGMVGDDAPILRQRLDGVAVSDIPQLFRENYWGLMHDGGLYRPLLLSGLVLQKAAWGDAMWAYRLVGLAMHAACVVMVFSLIVRCGGRAVPAFWGAAVFAAHPVHVEAVTTAYGQADLLAATFGLVAVHAAVTGQITGRLAWGVVAAMSYTAAMLCKESIVLLPAFVIIARVVSGPDHSWRSMLRRTDWLWLVALVAVVSLRFGALGKQAVPLYGKASVAFDYPWWARVNLFVTSLGESVRMLLWPTGQTSYYGHLRDDIFSGPYTPLLWITVGVIALVLVHRIADRRLTRLGVAWLALAMLPVVNLLPIGTAFADRFLYWPSVAVAIFVAAVLGAVSQAHRRTAAVCTALLLIIAVGQSAWVCVHWRTPLSHWQWTVAHYPRSPKGQALVAMCLLEAIDTAGSETEARLKQAQSHADTALELNKLSPEGWHARAIIHLLRGQDQAALDAIETSLRQRPNDPALLRTQRQALERVWKVSRDGPRP